MMKHVHGGGEIFEEWLRELEGDAIS